MDISDVLTANAIRDGVLENGEEARQAVLRSTKHSRGRGNHGEVRC
jgi:hypothetical protein